MGRPLRIVILEPIIMSRREEMNKMYSKAKKTWSEDGIVRIANGMET
jgi:hypothetical protein